MEDNSEIEKLRAEVNMLKQGKQRRRRQRSGALSESKKDKMKRIMETPDNELKASELEIKKRQMKIDAARANESNEITKEQLAAAGYREKPVGMKNPNVGLDTDLLRSDLINVMVPLPKENLKGDMFGQGKVKIFAGKGLNLLDDEATQRLSMLEHRFEEKDKSTNDVNVNVNADSEEKGELSTIENYILSLPIAKKYNIEPKDIALTAENQKDVSTVLRNDDGYGLSFGQTFFNWGWYYWR